jgi:hypothetical protein
VTEAEFEPSRILERFRERAEAVRRRGVPPIEGEERRRFIQQAQEDYMDFMMLADATVKLKDGILTFEVDLRPESERDTTSSPER